MLKILFSFFLLSFVYSVDFSTEVLPIFNNNCAACHTTNSLGGLNLSSYENLMSSDVVIPGDFSESLLYQRLILPESAQGNMPPTGSLDQGDIDLIATWIDEGALQSEESCDEGFIQISLDGLPNTCVVIDQSDCFYEGDYNVLSDIAMSNGMFSIDPLYIGSQNWLNGRLIRVQIGNYFQGGNVELTSLPESISGLDSLSTLQVDKNDLSALPDGVGDLSKLSILIASNNSIESIPESVGNLSKVWYLDLGYNELETLPQSISNMTSINYLYIFGNNISTLPESICDLDLTWSGVGNDFMPYFACGGNQLCENIPECVESSSNFEVALEANYYSFTISMPQECSELSNIVFEPYGFGVTSIYPNPFNPVAKISYEISELSDVSIDVHSVYGNWILNLFSGKMSPGAYTVDWNASELPSGMYFVKLKSNSKVQTQKAFLIK